MCLARTLQCQTCDDLGLFQVPCNSLSVSQMGASRAFQMTLFHSCMDALP